MKNKKLVAVILAAVLLLGGIAGGTLAWLTAETPKVENVFTSSNIDLELNETERTYKMVPGWTIDKDPVVTVKAGSEYCYLFVKVEETSGVAGYSFDDYLVYSIDNKWKELDTTNHPGVYYIEVDTAEKLAAQYNVLGAGSYVDDMGTNAAGDDVTVTWAENQMATKPSVTKEMMNLIDGVSDSGNAEAEIAARPKLTFTAYAVQLYKSNDAKFTPAEAWAQMNPSN